jgi:hypothetical protein
MFIILVGINSVYGTSMLNTIINSGTSWLGNATDENSIGSTLADYIKTDIVGLLADIGNLVFFIVAAFLGVKFIWSGVSGKSEVKETLPTFLVAATFFYSAQLIFNFFNGQFDVLFGYNNFEDISASIWSTIVVIVQILSIAGIIAIGLKYMLSAADEKANIKRDLLPMVVGLIFVFSITEIMKFIAGIGHSLFQ